MYGFQKIKLSFLFLLAIIASGLFVVHTTKAYEYNLGASRKYYNSTDAYIVGTGDNSGYERDYFTGLGYCTGYYYINYNTDVSGLANDIGLVRQSLKYDSSNIFLTGDYINLKQTTGQAVSWSTNNLYGYFSHNLNSLFRFNTSTPSGSPTLLSTYTLGRFLVNNTQAISDTTISLYYLAVSSNDESTYINHTNSDFNSNADRNYSFDIKYYAQPCVPDMPTTTTDRALINGSNGGTSDRLARIPAIHGLSTDLNSGRPVTVGSTVLSGRSNFIPANINLNSTFDQDISFDDGIYFAGIKEPDTNSVTSAYPQNYYYSSGGSRGSSFSGLDANFVAAVPGTVSNQWGIDPDTVKVTIAFTGVDKTVFGDDGAFCTVIITGETNLGLSGLGYSWNRNQLGYEVNIASGTIRTLAKAQCLSLAGITTSNIDLKRETVANISWDAYDFSNSMIISQNNNTVTYASPNRITGTTGYIFNSYSADPILSMATDNTVLNNGIVVYNIPIDNSQLLFTGTDVYAGVDSGTFLIIVSGYNSSIDKSDSRIDSGTPDEIYIFSGSDITKLSFHPHDGRFDYTGFVDFASKLTVTTGMHFDIYFEVKDFVGNKKVQNYKFRTPTYPNAPHANTQNESVQTNTMIAPIYMLDDIEQDIAADGDAGNIIYDYTTYYPSSSGLITKFEYISGSSYLNTTTDLVVTGYNGNNQSNVLVTLTGISFVFANENSYFTGTPHVSSGGVPMNDYLDTIFIFEILTTNINGITGVITYNMNVAPSCTESPGCTDPVYVFWGTDLTNAQTQRNAAMSSGIEYMKSNHWYPHWFAEIKQTGPNFYFTGVNLEADAKVLYCASTGNSLLINYNKYTGPLMDETNLGGSLSDTFTGEDLNIVGSDVFLFDVFTASISANYLMESVNGTDKMTIYVNRPLTGRVFYSVCELTGGSLDDFGCPENSTHNRTGDINWTQLTDQDVFTMTGWIEGGWMTGAQVNDWGTGFVSNGGGTRKYIRNITGDLQDQINTNGIFSINIENRTGSTNTVNHEVYWIDNTEVSMTGTINVVANQSAIVTLSGYNTGQLSAGGESNLIGDDEYVVTKFSGDVEAKIFENGFGSTISTGDFYLNGAGSGYNMIHEITFAEDREGEICVEDRAGNESCMEMEVTGIGEMKELIITVKPAFRPEPATSNTGYSIESGDFRFWIKSGTVWTQNYNSAITSDPKITTNKNGTGIVYIMTPATGAIYLVTFKGSGTLSAGFTGIWDNTITDMNFFSGAYASGLSSDYVYKYNNAGTIENYLKVGDISVTTSGQYDTVETSDFALINDNLTIGTNIIPEYRYDFDINDVISSMEQSMILQAYNNHGFIGYLELNDIIPMTGFVNL